MVTKGCTSAYTVWIQMVKEMEEGALTYKNVGKRVVKLFQHGILEEVKLEGVENLHGRKDYKLTMKGLEQLIPYCLSHPEDIQSVSNYLDRFKIEKGQFGYLLILGFTSAIKALNEYHEHTQSLLSINIELLPGHAFDHYFQMIDAMKIFGANVSKFEDIIRKGTSEAINGIKSRKKKKSS